MEEVQSYLTGDHPAGVHAYTDVALIGVFSSTHHDEIQRFRAAANELRGEFLLASVSSDIAFEANNPVFSSQEPPYVVVHRRGDTLNPDKIITLSLDPINLAEAFRNATLPSFPELTVFNFAQITTQGKPLVILFDDQVEVGKGGHKVVSIVIQTGAFNGFLFVWMDL